MSILLSLSTFGIVVGLILGISRIFTYSSRDIVRQRIKDFVIRPTQPVRMGKRAFRRKRDLFPMLTKFTIKRGLLKELDKELLRSGLPLRVSEFLFLNLFTTILSFLLLFFLTGNSLLSLFFALIVFFLPYRYLKMRQRRRIVNFNDQLPDFLNTVTNSLKSGYGFTQSIEIAIRDAPAFLSQEFRRVLQEMDRGLSLEEALENLRERIPNENLNLVISAILIQRESGGSLSKVLETLVSTIRERIRIEKEIKVLTAQGRLSGIVVGALPVVIGILVYLVNPGYLKPILTTSLGQLMLGLAVIMQIAGVVVIRRIIRIKF